MSKKTRGYTQLYAIVRLEPETDGSIENRITVTRILLTLEEAERETQRLNELNGPKGCLYFWQATRMHRNLVQLENSDHLVITDSSKPTTTGQDLHPRKPQ